ncbi:MAG TPA: beta-ketoacyl synthase chain length factor [Steroidobacteraceae bacterium]|nr:beta-ketoacyl synthase chain length factor [Steroidobacteraceae bacterium]
MPVQQAYIEGIGLWAPRLAGWDAARAILRGAAPAPCTPAPRPSPSLLAATERRRAPDTVCVALEVAASACAGAALEPRTLPSVFASTYGELPVTDYMCATLAATPALLSPTKFHNSVHNAAAGYWAIATGCLEPYTALAAHEDTFGAGLLTAAAHASTEDRPVLYVAYDIEARGAVATMAVAHSVLGAALVLAPHATPRSVARLSLDTAPARGDRATLPRPENAALVAGSALAESIVLFEALADGTARAIVQSLGPRLRLDIRIEPS